ncbi:gliding motility protein GldN [Bacteroidia bacterium]|nr:gliding motility protein GldN [Bacteroidia bacterium]
MNNQKAKSTWRGNHWINFFFVLFLIPSFGAYAQYESNAIVNFEKDFNYEKYNIKQRMPVSKCFLNEADMKYSKRVHSVIDTRQKQNHELAWEKSSLPNLLWSNLMNGNLTGYSTDQMDESDQYFYPDSLKEFVCGYEIFQILDTINSTPNNPVFITVRRPRDFYPKEYPKFRIMEDWVFDYKRGVMEQRIIGIAFISKGWLAGGIQDEREFPVVWIKMEQLRPILTNSELFNKSNDAGRLSYDDFFQLRLFDSYVVKESNEWDQDINMFPEFRDNGVDALLESERVKNDLFIFEHDLWEY